MATIDIVTKDTHTDVMKKKVEIWKMANGDDDNMTW